MNLRLSISEIVDRSCLALCFVLSYLPKSFSDYHFVNKHCSYLAEKINNIYLPRKGVLDQVLTYLKEAKGFFLNTKGSIFYLSGLARIPLTLLNGLSGDKSIVITSLNHSLGPAKRLIAIGNLTPALRSPK